MNPLLCLIVKLKNKIMKILFNIIIIYSIVFHGHAFSDQAQFVRNSDSLDVNNDDDDFCDHFFVSNTHYLSKQLNFFSDLMYDNTGVYVLEQGGGAFISRAWLSQNAENTIDVQYFIFSVDNIGLIVTDYLLRAAERGVKVRILLDDLMVDADTDDVLALDAHQNISIKIYNPNLNIGKNWCDKIVSLFTDFKGINQRMHNKTFIVDGNVAITGGRNIADEYFDYDHEYNFRDRDVLLIGEVSHNIQGSFDQFWNDEISRPISELVNLSDKNYDFQSVYKRLHDYACNPDNFWLQIRNRIKNIPSTFEEIKSSGKLIWVDSVAFVSDIPGKNNEDREMWGGGITTTALIELVEQAQNEILIQSPYLVTSDLSLGLFRNAGMRGVKIKILTNSFASTDNIDAFSGYQRNRNRILDTGALIFEYKPDAQIRKEIMYNDLQAELDYSPIFAIHAKSMVIDSKITVIGTFNLDPRSANLNTECVSIIYSHEIAENVRSLMEKELQPENSWEVTKSFNPDSEVGIFKRFKTYIRRIIPISIL